MRQLRRAEKTRQRQVHDTAAQRRKFGDHTHDEAAHYVDDQDAPRESRSHPVCDLAGECVSPERADGAVYIEVIIAPVDKSAAPNYAFAHVEFKGSRPRQATFYIQPDGEDSVSCLRKKFRFQIFGDGYTHNTDY